VGIIYGFRMDFRNNTPELAISVPSYIFTLLSGGGWKGQTDSTMQRGVKALSISSAAGVSS
jgi:hypothetical protein